MATCTRSWSSWARSRMSYGALPSDEPCSASTTSSSTSRQRSMKVDSSTLLRNDFSCSRARRALSGSSGRSIATASLIEASQQLHYPMRAELTLDAWSGARRGGYEPSTGSIRDRPTDSVRPGGCGGYSPSMKACCPPGQGCNAPPGREEPCLLRRVERSDAPDADRAVALWKRFVRAQRAHGSRRERRFLRRAYARARDSAVPWRPHLP